MRTALILLLLASPVSASTWSGSDFGAGSSSWHGGTAARAPAPVVNRPTPSYRPGFAGGGALTTSEMVAMGSAGNFRGKAASWTPAAGRGEPVAAPAVGGPFSWAFSPGDEERTRSNGIPPKPNPGGGGKPPPPIPLPPAAFLLLGGLAALAGIRRRKA